MEKHDKIQDPFLQGNDCLEEAIRAFHNESSKENMTAILETIRTRMHEDGHLIIPIKPRPEIDRTGFIFI